MCVTIEELNIRVGEQAATRHAGRSVAGYAAFRLNRRRFFGANFQLRSWSAVSALRIRTGKLTLAVDSNERKF
jgi:hypothetical protein